MLFRFRRKKAPFVLVGALEGLKSSALKAQLNERKNFRQNVKYLVNRPDLMASFVQPILDIKAILR